jgi:alcohol dehydrogenase (cytochrome c)
MNCAVGAAWCRVLDAMAGNLVFNADLDRWSCANIARTGAKLWKVRLNDTSHSFPITYMAEGKQYVAIPDGGVKPIMGIKAALMPEIRTPPFPGDSVLWAFALNDD